MVLKGKKVALLVDDLYEDLEVWYPRFRLQESGAEVVIVAAEAQHVYKSKHGYPIESDIAYPAARPSYFDGVIIPGGYAPDRIRRSTVATGFVREMDRQEKLVASICHGPWVLCSAGILKGRRLTCFHSVKDDVVNAGAEYEDSEVVVDRNLVTSRQPDDLPAFCRAAIRLLAHAIAEA